MVFYVPLGLRGILFRIGTALICVGGGLTYWRASRRRALRIDPASVLDVAAEAPAVV